MCLFPDGDFAWSIIDENEEILSKVTDLINENSPHKRLFDSLPLIHLTQSDLQNLIDNLNMEKNYDCPLYVERLHQICCHSENRFVFERLGISYIDYEELAQKIGNNSINYQPLLQLFVRHLVGKRCDKIEFIFEEIRKIIEQPRLQTCLHELIMCLKNELRMASETEIKNTLELAKNLLKNEKAAFKSNCDALNIIFAINRRCDPSEIEKLEPLLDDFYEKLIFKIALTEEFSKDEEIYDSILQKLFKIYGERAQNKAALLVKVQGLRRKTIEICWNQLKLNENLLQMRLKTIPANLCRYLSFLVPRNNLIRFMCISYTVYDIQYMYN